MMLLTLATIALLLAIVGSALAQTCESFGDDFQNGGSYFQNNLSSDPFTALQDFDGCQNDTANNVLVNPNGDQSQCSNTPLLPNDTPQLITCADWPKDKLYNGSWSLLIISNNGNGSPIAYQRDFSLSVGPQHTLTVTATATITNQNTPVVNVTQTSTSTYTTTVPSSTTTVQATVTPTTITPAPSVVRMTKGLFTLTQVVQTVQVSSIAKTVPASCTVPQVTRVKDPIAQIVPTEDVAGLIGLSSILKRSSGSAAYKRAILVGRTPSDELKQAFVENRNKRLAKVLHKRAPDQPTITVTATNAATSTISQVGATTTQTVTVVVSQTSTSTSGIATVDADGQRSTITAVASTRTTTVNVAIAMVTSTQTKHLTFVADANFDLQGFVNPTSVSRTR
ncbi:hypothetical protein LTS16_015346 [Friedmanniomyces endolithicus]|nr:hypothetical protein LTR54_016122 [Friedmanniomyces endolithicus]KAK1034523.1 hypothetical protein LTS16_015346 [Friedmanniomyces endolithicus]